MWNEAGDRQDAKAVIPDSSYAGIYQATIDAPGPTNQDLTALCKEKDLDFVVLPRAFKGFAAETNGSVFIYDCRSIRNRLEMAGQVAVSVDAPGE